MSMQPGWYPDPFSQGGYVRWWDGQRWGASQTAPEAAPVTDPPGGPASSAPGAPAAPGAWGAPTPPPPQAPSPPPYPGGQYGAPGYGAPYGQQVATFPLATWGQRAVAKIIDIVIETLVTLPFALWLLWPAVSEFVDSLPTDGSMPSDAALASFQTEVLGLSFSLSLVSAAVTFLYEVPQNVWWGRTLGMRLLSIRIRPLAADVALTWGQATIRWGTYAVGALIAGGLWTLIDYLWPLWDKPWRQALHDKTAKTVVVPTP